MNFTKRTMYFTSAWCLALFVLPVTGCQLFSPTAKPLARNELPRLAIATAVISEGETVIFYGQKYTLDEINTENYPSTLRISQASQAISIEVESWEIRNNVLIQASLPRSGASQNAKVAQLKFYNLPELWNNWPAPNNPEVLFEEKEFREGNLEIFKDGVISLDFVRDNDPLNNLDETAQARIYFEGNEYDTIVREFSHTLVSGGLYLNAEEIFSGNREREGLTRFSLLREAGAFDDHISSKKITLERHAEVPFGSLVVTPDFIPVASKNEALGIESKPETYRCILTIRNTVDDSVQEFILNTNQSQRWGNMEWFLNEVTAEEASFTVYEYAKNQYPSNRRSVDDALVGESERESAKAPRWIERELSLLDSIEFQSATITVVSIRTNDSANLFDDQVEVSVVARNLAQTILLREGTKQIVRGNNRWWIIEAKDVIATGNRGKAILRIESDQIVGAKQ
ncbi:MAG: hypothetical protein ACFCU1_03465 [Sumerlaeia bacterium]